MPQKIVLKLIKSKNKGWHIHIKYHEAQKEERKAYFNDYYDDHKEERNGKEGLH